MTDKKHINDLLKNSDKNFSENCTHDKEQIIIDGVNVYGCVQFIQEEEDCCNLGGSCKGWPNCYYKQLARTTQECEQKDKEINELHLIIDRLLEASGYDKNISSAEDFEDVYADIDYKLGLLDELKQECEELKKQLEFVRTHRTVKDAEKDRYRKALEEIGEIVKINCEEICGRKFEDCNDFLCPSKNIIDIINKAKGEENE